MKFQVWDDNGKPVLDISTPPTADGRCTYVRHRELPLRGTVAQWKELANMLNNDMQALKEQEGAV